MENPTYFFKWNPKEVKKLLKESDAPCTNFYIGICAGKGHATTFPAANYVMTIKYLDDWLYGDFDTLMLLNKAGVISSEVSTLKMVEQAKELNVSRQTISHDMRAINKMTNKGLFGLAKETLTTMYFSCLNGIEQVQREAWKVYNDKDNYPSIKIAALRLLKDASESKYNMFTGAPTIM
jgi:hypothetical protein